MSSENSPAISTEKRLADLDALSDKLGCLISEALDDRDQFKRYIVVEKSKGAEGDSFSENVEKIYNKVDFKSVKEAAGAIKALADAVLTASPKQESAGGIVVSFADGGDEAM